MQRFVGTVEALAEVDVSGLATWIQAISLEDWPQQHRLADGALRPAMVSDHNWHCFGTITQPIVDAILPLFHSCFDTTRLLSVVMPGHNIPKHCDWQAPNWICRIHTPITTNEKSKFIVGATDHQMHPGIAYMVNTEEEHSVINDGATPRIHFMFDVMGLR